MTRQITLYTFEELSSDAQDEAVVAVREKLGGVWWESSDNDDLADVIRYEFARCLKTPGWDDYGVGDFTGVPGVTLESWDLDTGRIVFSGVLTRDNAPGLPWQEGDHEARFARNEVWVFGEEGEMTLNVSLEPAVHSATHEALQAAQDEADYKTGETVAREWCEGNEEQEYHENGELA